MVSIRNQAQEHYLIFNLALFKVLTYLMENYPLLLYYL